MKKESDIKRMAKIMNRVMDRIKKGDDREEIRKEMNEAIVREKLTIKDHETK